VPLSDASNAGGGGLVGSWPYLTFGGGVTAFVLFILSLLLLARVRRRAAERRLAGAAAPQTTKTPKAAPPASRVVRPQHAWHTDNPMQRPPPQQPQQLRPQHAWHTDNPMQRPPPPQPRQLRLQARHQGGGNSLPEQRGLFPPQQQRRAAQSPLFGQPPAAESSDFDFVNNHLFDR
jgi:hypothetical protein